MHNAAARPRRDRARRPERQPTAAVVSDLVALIEHVQASLRLIERAIAQEASLGDQEAPHHRRRLTE